MVTNTDSKNQQIEFDVFPKEKKQKNSYPFDSQNDMTRETTSINVVFSNQSVIVIIICVVLLLVASFTLGVEKGKLILRNSGGETIPTAQKNEAPPVDQAVTPPENKPENNTEQTTVSNPVELIPKNNIEPLVGLTKIKNETPKAGYTIQVASVKTENAAKELVASLMKKGVPSFTKTSGKYIIVLAGNFKKREDAQLELKELKKSFNDCFIRKI